MQNQILIPLHASYSNLFLNKYLLWRYQNVYLLLLAACMLALTRPHPTSYFSIRFFLQWVGIFFSLLCAFNFLVILLSLPINVWQLKKNGLAKLQLQLNTEGITVERSNAVKKNYPWSIVKQLRLRGSYLFLALAIDKTPWNLPFRCCIHRDRLGDAAITQLQAWYALGKFAK